MLIKEEIRRRIKGGGGRARERERETTLQRNDQDELIL